MSETNIYNLPFEMIEKIGSYLPDIDLVKLSFEYEEFQEICSCKKSFDFSDGKIDEETFVKAMEVYGSHIKSINISNCGHLSAESIATLTKLKDLHVIVNDFEVLLRQKKVPTGLKRLSIDDCFYFIYMNYEDGDYAAEVFHEVEELNVSVRKYDIIGFLYTCMDLLEMCPNLVSLKVSGYTKKYEEFKSDIDDEVEFAIYYDLMPKLKPQNVKWDIKDSSEAPVQLKYEMTVSTNPRFPNPSRISYCAALGSFTLNIMNTK
jgi:hypothetical protein